VFALGYNTYFVDTNSGSSLNVLAVSDNVMYKRLRSPDGLSEMFTVVSGAVCSNPLWLDVKLCQSVTLCGTGGCHHRNQHNNNRRLHRRYLHTVALRHSTTDDKTTATFARRLPITLCRDEQTQAAWSLHTYIHKSFDCTLITKI